MMQFTFQYIRLRAALNVRQREELRRVEEVDARRRRECSLVANRAPLVNIGHAALLLHHKIKGQLDFPF